MRRLPVYLLLDTSGSMKGEPIESVKAGLQTMLSTLKQDPFALESVHISIITFDTEVKLLTGLSDLENFTIPEIVVPESGATHFGAALELLCKCLDSDIRKTTPEQKGDWKPLLFIMTDGRPADIQKYKEMIPEVQKRNFAGIIACAAGPKAKQEDLKLLTDKVVSLDTADSATFQQFFKWVSDTIGKGNMSRGATSQITLPPPPSEIHIVV